MTDVFGRTNTAYPKVWMRPLMAGAAEADALAVACVAHPTVIDPSSSPSFWGAALRGTKTMFVGSLGSAAERGANSIQTSELIQGEIIALLSSLGADCLEFVSLPIRRALDEAQIAGALEAIELARSEGLVRHCLLAATGPEMAVLGVWQFHDAFEGMILPRHRLSGDGSPLIDMAKARRAGICLSEPAADLQMQEAADPVSALFADLASRHHVLKEVRSASEVEALFASQTAGARHSGDAASSLEARKETQ